MTFIPYTEYEPQPEGIYLAKVSGIEEREGEKNNYLLITFDILDGPSEGQIAGTANMLFSKKSKLYDWARVLNGGNDAGFENGFKDDLILGKIGKLVVKHVKKDDVVRDRIESILPVTMEEIREWKAKSETKKPEPEPEPVSAWDAF